MHERIKLGSSAETLVAHKMTQEGFELRDRNYRTHIGEIDLIVQKNNLLVFIEVKMRSTPYFDLAQVITKEKQRKIISSAYFYLEAHTLHEMEYRFDVALVELYNNNPKITYIPHAFME